MVHLTLQRIPPPRPLPPNREIQFRAAMLVPTNRGVGENTVYEVVENIKNLFSLDRKTLTSPIRCSLRLCFIAAIL